MAVGKYRTKNVAILGFGLEGRSVYKYLRDNGAVVSVFDEKKSSDHPEGTTVDRAEDWELDDFDFVVRAPSIAPRRIKTSSELTSLTQIFFEHCPAPIIGVTGTKGKGTVATLIAKILEYSGKKVHLLGNIGKPALDELDNISSGDYVVYELSSFQLWDMTMSPQIAVVLMIEPEHLDVHQDTADYLSAKANIVVHQNADDLVIYHPFNEMSKNVAIRGKGVKSNYMSAGSARINFGDLVVGTTKIMPSEEFGLIGSHNRENICAALSATWTITQDVAAARKAMAEFKGLEHRLEFVKEVGGVRYYNDSFATTPGAAVAAINSFDGPELIILGGSDKKSDYSDLAEAVSVRPNIKQVYLIGEMADKIDQALRAFDFVGAKKLTGDIDEIVRTVAKNAKKGDVVLLSPAAASFDMFENYKKRGELFKKAVRSLFGGV